jgi:hypothetical protein
VPFQLFGPNDSPKIRRDTEKSFFRGLVKTSWDGTSGLVPCPLRSNGFLILILWSDS